MQLTVLGCWAPYPRPGEACSGYLLQSGSTNLMLEIGNGSFAELTKHIDYRSLTGLVVTHFHPDHYADLTCLRHAIEGAQRENKMAGQVTLFLPPQPAELFEQFARYNKAFDVVCIADLPDTGDASGLQAKQAKLGELDLYFAPTKHSQPGYAIFARDNQTTFCFSGDTAASQEMQLFAQDADLFLCEASGMESDADYLRNVHLTARQAGALAQAAKVKKLVLTHFWPEYDPKDLLTQARQEYNGELETAVHGKKYIFNSNNREDQHGQD